MAALTSRGAAGRRGKRRLRSFGAVRKRYQRDLNMITAAEDRRAEEIISTALSDAEEDTPGGRRL